MATQTDGKANIGVITLSRPKKQLKLPPPPFQQEGGGGEAVQKNQNWTMTKILR